MSLEEDVKKLEKEIKKLKKENEVLKTKLPKEQTYLEALESEVLNFPMFSMTRMVGDSKYMKFTTEEIERLRQDERSDVINSIKGRLKDFRKRYGDRELKGEF